MNNGFVDILSENFTIVWGGVLSFIPNLIVALVVFLLGWVIAVFIGKAVSQIIDSLKIDNVLRKTAVDNALARAGFGLNMGGFLGAIVKWFFIIVSLLISLEILGLSQVNDFLQRVIDFLPHVFIAAIILIVAAFVADATHRLVAGSAKAADVPSAHFMAGIAKWAIWVFAILATLEELNIAQDSIQTLFMGLVVMLALAGGLSFGLGGKDVAARYIEKLRSDINEK